MTLTALSGSANLSCKTKAGKLRHWLEASQTADLKSFALRAAGRQHRAWLLSGVMESNGEYNSCAQMRGTQNLETEPPGSWEPTEKAGNRHRENELEKQPFLFLI